MKRLGKPVRSGFRGSDRGEPGDASNARGDLPYFGVQVVVAVVVGRRGEGGEGTGVGGFIGVIHWIQFIGFIHWIHSKDSFNGFTQWIHSKE